MGFWNRLSGTATGVFGGLVEAPAMFAWDMARAPFTAAGDHTDGNPIKVIYASGVVRGGDALENLFGPNEGLGAAINAIPEQIRQPVGGVATDVFDGFEWVGREGIREPLAAAMIAASLADSPEYGDRGFLGLESLGRMFRGDIWERAYEMAQDQSVGQSVALAIGTRDILDENEVNDFVNTDMYEITSGMTDLAFRIFLEPDVIVGGPLVRLSRSRRAIGIGSDAGRTVPIAADLAKTPRIPLIGSYDSPALQRASEALAANFDRIPASMRWVVTDFTTDIGKATAAEVRGLRGQARNARRTGRALEAERLARRADLIEAGDLASDAQRFAQHIRTRDIEKYMQTPARRRFVDRVPFMTSKSYARFDGAIQGLIDEADDVNEATALIRDRLFRDHSQGDTIAHFFAEAGTEAERRTIMRFFLGDMDALRVAKQQSPRLARQLQDLVEERAIIRADPDYNLLSHGPDGQLGLRLESPLETDKLNYTERLSTIDDEIADLQRQYSTSERFERAWKSIDTALEPTVGQQVRHRVRSSEMYQTSPYARPLRVVTNMRPQHLLNVADPVADSHFARSLRDSGMSEKEINRWRGQFSRAQIDERAQIVGEAFQEVERKIMRDVGMSPDEIGAVMEHANRGRRKTLEVIRSATYDGEGRANIRHIDGEIIEQPIMATQLEHVLPVTDWKRVQREAERYARIKHGEGWRAGLARSKPNEMFHAGKDMSTLALDNFMSTWKVGVLLRPAWTMRVVMLDEQMRMAAKFGAMATLLSRRGVLNNFGMALKNHDRIGPMLKLDDAGKVGKGRVAGTALAGMLVAGTPGAIAGAGLGYGLLRHLGRLEEAGAVNLTMGSYRVAAAYGAGNTKADIYRAQVSSGQGLREFVGAYEGSILGKWRANTDQWTTHIWNQRDELAQAKYREAWSNVISRHHVQDPMARMVLEGASPADLIDWLENTLDGRRHAARVPLRGRSSAAREQWAEAVHDQVVTYTGGMSEAGDAARRAILNLPEDAKQRQWNTILDDIPEEARPAIHGPEFEQVLGTRSEILDGISATVETAFDVMGTMATDELSRNPTFIMFYEQEMRRQVADVPAGVLDAGDLARMETNARNYALRETRELLYDLAERSEFAELTRFLMPFFPAAQEVLTRWAGLAYENPAIIPRMHDLWNAPNRAGWTYTDDQGEDHIVIRIPEFARGIVNHSPMFGSALDSQGQIRLPKKGFNLILSNPIGFGPFVQIPVSQVVRERPELEESMRFVIPFGPVDATASIIPPVVRDAIQLTPAQEHLESRAYASAHARNIITRLTRMQAGEIEQVDLNDPVARGEFLQAVTDETNAFWSLRTAVRWVAPVAPIYDSPYQPYIDVFRALSNDDTKRAAEIASSIPGVSVSESEIADMLLSGDVDEAFLDLFGDEFFAVTTRLSESNNGVPPTLEALEGQREFSDLITRHPDWGSVIIGRDGGGQAVQFSRAAYDRQLETPLQPGSDTMERERKSNEELISDGAVRLGWHNYSRAMDGIDAIRMQRGLPSMNVKGAEDLRAAKSAIIAGLASKYPAWFAEFSITDRNRWNVKLQGARAIASEERLLGRDDIRGLAEYLQVRDAIVAALAARGSNSIDAVANQDLRQAFDLAVGHLVDTNAAFADLYYRTLERDPLDPSTLPAAA